eukprot:29120-Pelagococcus_subviridis.AAC.12
MPCDNCHAAPAEWFCAHDGAREIPRRIFSAKPRRFPSLFPPRRLTPLFTPRRRDADALDSTSGANLCARCDVAIHTANKVRALPGFFLSRRLARRR